MCSCSGTCGCTPQSAVQAPVRALPAEPTVIDIGVDMLPAGSVPTVLGTGVPPLQHFQFGIPFNATAVFNPVVPTTTGLVASAVIDNTDPLNPQLMLVLVDGQAGTNGVSPFTEMTASFTVPAVDGLATITVADTSWMTLGSWVYVKGAGAAGFNGGWFVCASNPLSATQTILRNPGTTDGISPANGYVDGLPQNAVAGTVVVSSGDLNQVLVAGIPGPRGAAGAPGGTPNVELVYAIPVAAPVGDTDTLKLYFNAAPPTPATVVQFYAWNAGTVSWDAGPNLAGTAGTLSFVGVDDPNITPPGGSAIGSLYFRVAGTMLSIYVRTGVSTWMVVGTPISLLGTTTATITHSSAGKETLDLGYFSTYIEVTKDLELDWSSANYAGQGKWVVTIYNSSASPIDLTFTAAQWEADPALGITPPVAIAVGDTQVIEFVQSPKTALYSITNFYVSTAL